MKNSSMVATKIDACHIAKLVAKIAICLFVFIAPIFISNSTYAVSEVELKTALAGLRTCYINGGIRTTLTVNDYNTNALTYGATNSKIKILMPSGVEISCQQLFYGGVGSGPKYTGFKISDLTSFPSNTSSPEAKGQFLKNMGYQETTSGGSGSSCAYFTYDVTSEAPVNTILDILMPTYYYYTTVTTLCTETKTDSSGKLVIDSDKMTSSRASVDKSNNSDYPLAIGGLHITTSSSKKVTCSNNVNGSSPFATVNFAKGDSWDAFLNSLISEGCAPEGITFYGNIGGIDTSTRVGTFERDPGGEAATEYSIDGRASFAANDAIKFLTNGRLTGGTLGLTEDEKATLLLGYLKSTYNAVNAGCNLTGDELKFAEADGYIPARIDEGNGFQQCYIKPADANKNKKVYGWDSSNILSKNESWDFARVVSELNKMTLTSVSDSSAIGTLPSSPANGGSNPSGGESGDGTVSEITACYKNAGVLGWILCPVLKLTSDVTEKLYSYIEDSFLQIKSGVMTDASVNEGWKTFRDFANILFAILFAVVILAQVTGIGISNYNIKKILPRLLMIVVLVNISFVLCQLMVDISNIVGTSLRKMFEDFAQTAAKASGGVPFDLGTVLSGAGDSLFAIGITAGVTAVFAITIPWEIWLLPFFLSVLSCIIGILFFLLILGARQAAVIIMVTIAPFAIVCYALPNTKSLFDKWWKLFTALLMVYPICGALMGGGTFASTLLLIAGNNAGAGAFFTIVAMLVTVMPFFMIPSILKNSMALMGNLGMKISQFGKGMSGRLQSGIRNSEFGRDAQRRANMNYADRAARKLERREKFNKNVLGKSDEKSLTRSQRARLGRYNSMYRRLMFDDVKAGSINGRPKIGTPEYDAMIGNEASEQNKRDIAGRQANIKNNMMQRVTTGHEGEILNGNSDDDMQEELDTYLDKIITNSDGDEKTADYVKNAQAIINTLSDSKSGGARARVVNSLSDAMFRNAGVLTDANNRDRLRKSFSKIGERTRDAYGGDYKKDHPGTMALLSDIAQGNFTRAGDFTEVVQEMDIDGNLTGRTHRRSRHYSQAGLSGMTDEDFSKLKVNGASNILDALRHDNLSGGTVSALASMADRVLNSPNYVPDADVRPYMEQIRNAAFGNRVIPEGETRTSGSMTIGTASSSGIQSILDRVQSSGDWSTLSAEQQQEYGNLVSNIQESMQNDSFSQENAGRLEQAMALAKEKGFRNASGQVITDANIPKIAESRIKIDHSKAATPAPKQISELAYPSGLTRSTETRSTRNGRQTSTVWLDSNGRKVTDQALIEQAEEVHRLNQKIREQNALNGFGSNQNNNGGNP